jgi:hypothetical protein
MEGLEDWEPMKLYDRHDFIVTKEDRALWERLSTDEMVFVRDDGTEYFRQFRCVPAYFAVLLKSLLLVNRRRS